MSGNDPDPTAATIVAIGSAVGPAARMIVRTSGPRSHELAEKLGVTHRRGAYHAVLRIDDVECPAWVYAFTAPQSYTGEDAVEYHLPGSPVLASMLVSTLLARGATAAGPGEFTARAYFHGKLDLAGAEAVAAAIAAHSDRELRAAARLRCGELSDRLMPLMNDLADTLALVEVGIDFADEDVTAISPAQLRDRLTRLDTTLADLLATSGRFERLSHRPRLVLAGRPNAGKSTLLNALAGRDRAVVSATAGTTRDALSATIAVRRGLIELVDVAGLDDAPQGPIAQDMLTAAWREMRRADAMVLMTAWDDPRPPPQLPLPPRLRITTKSDLAEKGTSLFLAEKSDVPFMVSARRGIGLDALRDALDRVAFGDDAAAGEQLALSARHVDAIGRARHNVGRAIASANSPAELLAVELREALGHLGSILGLVTPDDLLGRVFSRFCIGK